MALVEAEEVGVVIVIGIILIVVLLGVAELLPLEEGVEEVAVLGRVPREEEVALRQVEAPEAEEVPGIVNLLLARRISVGPQGLLPLIESVIDLPRIGIDHPRVLLPLLKSHHLLRGKTPLPKRVVIVLKMEDVRKEGKINKKKQKKRMKRIFPREK